MHSNQSPSYYEDRANEIGKLTNAMIKDGASRTSVAAMLDCEAALWGCASGASIGHSRAARYDERARTATAKAGAIRLNIDSLDMIRKSWESNKPETYVLVGVNDIADLVSAYDHFRTKATGKTPDPEGVNNKLRSKAKDRISCNSAVHGQWTELTHAEHNEIDIALAAAAAKMEAPVVLTEGNRNGDWRVWTADRTHYTISLNFTTGDVHLYKEGDFIDCDHVTELERLSVSVMTCALKRPDVDRLYVRKIVQAFAALNPPAPVSVLDRIRTAD